MNLFPSKMIVFFHYCFYFAEYKALQCKKVLKLKKHLYEKLLIMTDNEKNWFSQIWILNKNKQKQFAILGASKKIEVFVLKNGWFRW